MKCCPWGVRGCGGSCYAWLSAQDGKALDLMKSTFSQTQPCSPASQTVDEQHVCNTNDLGRGWAGLCPAPERVRAHACQ